MYSKEPSPRDGSFEFPQHMFKLMDKRILKILHFSRVLFLAYGKIIKTSNDVNKKANIVLLLPVDTLLPAVLCNAR